ncbi:metal-dependent phosphohydrolase [Rhodothermaceae bacterium RA]|nr:metal-dependent phosphohydrolase [Rhodothermaceae bacterium RA]
MGFLEQIGFNRRKARPVGQRLERGFEDEKRARRQNVLVKAAIFLVLVVITVAAFPRDDIYDYTVEVGRVWQRETVVAPFDYAIRKQPEQLAEERRQIRRTTPPIFRRLADAPERIRTNRDMVEQQLEAIFEAYTSYRLHASRGRLEDAARDSARYMELRRSAWPKLTPAQWQLLLNDVAERVPGLTSTNREPRTGPPLYVDLLNKAALVGNELVRTGVLNIPRDSIQADRVRVVDDAQNSYTEYPKDRFLGLNDAYTDSAPAAFAEYYPGRPDLVSIASAFFRAIFVPTFEFQREATYQAWQEAEQMIEPVYGKVRAGQEIVRNGQVVDEQTRQLLISLEQALEERSGTIVTWQRMLGQLLLTLITYFLFFLYLYLLRRQIFDDNRQILLISLVFAGIVGLFALALRAPMVVMYGVPVGIVSVLLTVIYDSRVGLFGTLTLALLGAHLLDYDFLYGFSTLFAGTLAVFSVRDIKNRGQVFLSAGLVFLGYAVVFLATWLFSGTSLEVLLRYQLMVLVGSFLMLAAYLLLWVFERAFDITTDLTLLELSNTNRPLLKELSLRAPGTFNHTLQVANLAEAAADSIGANALLARVGALYHDIGKMLKPEYFVENQRPGQNPHDALKPRMSALIIASHVKEGLELGRQYRLPKRVLDFIPMHHGTTRIEYFYRKACEQQGEGGAVQDAEFRYPGPRPNSKETGILMLADSVEAASRSLSEPTHKRLETLIDMIFKARIEDGQLSDTDLTFRDLNRIKETFLSVLLGIYHVRVKYPGQPEETSQEAAEDKPMEVEADREAAAPDTAGPGEAFAPPDARSDGRTSAPVPDDEDDLGLDPEMGGRRLRAPNGEPSVPNGDEAPAEDEAAGNDSGDASEVSPGSAREGGPASRGQ